MNQIITSDLRRKILSTVKQAKYPDISRIAREIEEHLIESRLSTKEVSALLERLANNHPWEYLREWAEFYESKFIVSKDTLIPRLETEMLVDLAIKKVEDSSKPFQIIDVGTGSGAIIMSIVKKLLKTNQKASYFATDISERALKIATQNHQNIIPEADITFINTSLLETDKIDFTSPTLILANLPYIGEEEYRSLDKSVKEHEPYSALVGGNIGHELYIQLLDQSKSFTEKPIQIWEASPTTIPYLGQYLDKKEIPHQTVRDQFQIERFIVI